MESSEIVTSAEVRAQTKSQQLVVQPCVGAWPCRLSPCELSKRSATQHTTHLPCLHCNLFRLVISEPGGSAAVPLHIDAVSGLLLGEV